MGSKFRIVVHSLITFFLITVISTDIAAQEKPLIRFGVLPALQALPLFVAESKGLFSKNGLNVDLILFNTTGEKDVALASGSLDGCFADLVTPLVLKANGRDIIVIAKNYDTRYDRRMFGIMVKPGSAINELKSLAGASVAISSNSVIDLVNDKLQMQAGITKDNINTIEFKNIGLRFQALLTGRLDAAVLPEPLVSVAISKGAKLLADDSGLGESQTVLVFSQEFIKKSPELIKVFLNVINDTNRLINSNPDSVRDIMVEKVRLPEALKMKYPVPKFPKLALPDRDCLENIGVWLNQRGVIRSDIKYEQVVNGEFLP